ncbi:LAGLIDADG family homing endonuclease [Streptomyces sp. NPDC006743]|uniref:LAGLIDADG family homing endonuclease n=1 Tax=Streptomyces sp. NPDC006743 TaxID=3154480 RepID=UPI0034516191
MADRELNATRFMDLTDPAYAYMFGFLQADGHLHQGPGRKGRLTVEISARDINLLRSFQELTPYNSSITGRSRSTNFAKTSHTAVWSLCSLEARTRLNDLGLPYGRKSTSIAPPSGDFSRRDYLRGVIDADGSVGFTGNGFPFVSLTTASTSTATYLCQYVKEITGAERTVKRNTRDSIYNILYTMETAQTLAGHLWYPGCLSLDRKREAADSLTTWTRPSGMRAASRHRRWSEREDRVLLELKSPLAAAQALGRTENSCSLRLWRLRNGLVPRPADQ